MESKKPAPVHCTWTTAPNGSLRCPRNRKAALQCPQVQRDPRPLHSGPADLPLPQAGSPLANVCLPIRFCCSLLGFTEALPVFKLPLMRAAWWTEPHTKHQVCPCSDFLVR